MKNKLSYALLTLYFAMFSLASCGDKDEVTTEKEFDIADYTISEVTAEDLRNSGDPSDISISFTGATAKDDISEYWIVAVKSSSADATVDGIKSLDTERFEKVENTRSTYAVELSSSLKDIEGELISFDNEYVFYVLTIGSFNEEEVYALSNSSNATQLIQNVETSTLVAGFRGNGAITIDDSGNLYVNEFGAGSGNAGLGTSAFKITPEGIVDEFVSNLSGPVGNTLDADGNYYLNNGNEGVSGDFTRIAPDGAQTILATIQGYPTDILTGVNDDFFIANWTEPTVHNVTKDGVVTVFASDERLAGCTGIAYDDDQNIIVGNFSTGLIMSLDADGVISVIATIPTVVSGFVIGYIDYFEGHVYATGYGSNKIYKVSLTGGVTEFAGNGALASVDGELAKASFRTPNGIAIDGERRILYVSQNTQGNSTSLRAIPLEEEE